MRYGVVVVILGAMACGPHEPPWTLGPARHDEVTGAPVVVQTEDGTRVQSITIPTIPAGHGASLSGRLVGPFPDDIGPMLARRTEACLMCHDKAVTRGQ